MKRKEKGTFLDPDIVSDPNGCYTGVPENIKDMPVQDADDL